MPTGEAIKLNTCIKDKQCTNEFSVVMLQAMGVDGEINFINNLYHRTKSHGYLLGIYLFFTILWLWVH